VGSRRQRVLESGWEDADLGAVSEDDLLARLLALNLARAGA
jgi:hypothetical protein